MKVSEVFASRFVSAGDLRGQEVELVISDVAIEDIDHDGTAKPVIKFEGHRKSLVLNKTNAKAIAKLHGDVMDEWVGKTVTLYPDETTFKGETVPCIRVRVFRPKPADTSDASPSF